MDMLSLAFSFSWDAYFARACLVARQEIVMSVYDGYSRDDEHVVNAMWQHGPEEPRPETLSH